MPPPNRDRVRVSMWLARSGVAAVSQLAEKRGVPVADVYRAVFAAGYPIVAKDLQRAAARAKRRESKT